MSIITPGDVTFMIYWFGVIVGFIAGYFAKKYNFFNRESWKFSKKEEVKNEI